MAWALEKGDGGQVRKRGLMREGGRRKLHRDVGMNGPRMRRGYEQYQIVVVTSERRADTCTYGVLLTEDQGRRTATRAQPMGFAALWSWRAADDVGLMVACAAVR